MAINLLAIQPHQVSRDLSGYITYVYGEAKTGKTTLASKMPSALLLAFERGYNAIPGIMAQDITTWGELKQVIRELKKPEVQAVYKSIVVDTVDIAAGLCEKYVCSQAGVEKLSDIPYGGGWTRVKKEFEEAFRTITQHGYALVFISHAKDKVFKTKEGIEYNQTIPSCPTTYNEIAKNMADVYAYAEKWSDDGQAKVRLILRSLDNSADTGCRFKYIKPVIPFEYRYLVDAINEAIDQEASLSGQEYYTNERTLAPTAPTYDYDGLLREFGDLVGDLMAKDPNRNQPRITTIVERYLGKGKKVAEATLDQAEFIYLINSDIKAELM